ncbi:MAG: aminoacyl-tRNA hydrolase [Eubacteriales bacterium]
MSNIFDLFKKIEINPPKDSKPINFIVCGLGNPGNKYAQNRHNTGFMCMDYMAQKLNININRLKFKSLCGEGYISDSHVLLMKPQTFMNKSGEALREAVVYYKIPYENIIIIFDDINLAPGVMRVKRKGSDGGHNGIKSIIEHLGSQNFQRIKIGVGLPPEGWELMDWVLGNISEESKEPIFKCIQASLPCTELIISGNTDIAMNTYNKGNINE